MSFTVAAILGWKPAAMHMLRTRRPSTVSGHMTHGSPASRAMSQPGAPASVTGLMGPNGSGKTTLFNLVDGTVRASGGRITLAGRRVERSGRAA
jgi:ABC-type multidrug transport system ATPase subunit